MSACPALALPHFQSYAPRTVAEKRYETARRTMSPGKLIPLCKCPGPVRRSGPHQPADWEGLLKPKALRWIRGSKASPTKTGHSQRGTRPKHAPAGYWGQLSYTGHQCHLHDTCKCPPRTRAVQGYPGLRLLPYKQPTKRRYGMSLIRIYVERLRYPHQEECSTSASAQRQDPQEDVHLPRPSDSMDTEQLVPRHTTLTFEQRTPFGSAHIAGGVTTRHATSVRQGNWFSVGIGPVSKATQQYLPPAPPELSRNVPRPACGSVGSCSIGLCLSRQTLVASLVTTTIRAGCSITTMCPGAVGVKTWRRWTTNGDGKGSQRTCLLSPSRPRCGYTRRAMPMAPMQCSGSPEPFLKQQSEEPIKPPKRPVVTPGRVMMMLLSRAPLQVRRSEHTTRPSNAAACQRHRWWCGSPTPIEDALPRPCGFAHRYPFVDGWGPGGAKHAGMHTGPVTEVCGVCGDARAPSQHPMCNSTRYTHASHRLPAPSQRPPTLALGGAGDGAPGDAGRCPPPPPKTPAPGGGCSGSTSPPPYRPPPVGT